MNPESPLPAGADSADSVDNFDPDADSVFDPDDVTVLDVSTGPDIFKPVDVVPADLPADLPPKPDTKKFTARTGPPSLEEWQDFIGKIVLRTVTEFYLDFALRDIRDLLSDREMEEIRLTKDELKDLAAPFASLAYKSKLARKRGRQIIEASNSIEAMFALMIWTRRVNRITKKYRAPKNPKKAVQQHGNSGQYVEQGTPEELGGFAPGIFNPGTG